MVEYSQFLYSRMWISNEADFGRRDADEEDRNHCCSSSGRSGGD